MTKRTLRVVHYAENDSDDDDTFLTIKRKRKRSRLANTKVCIHAALNFKIESDLFFF